MEKCYYIQTNLYDQVKDHKTLTKNYNEPNVTRDVQDRERDRLREVASKKPMHGSNICGHFTHNTQSLLIAGHNHFAWLNTSGYLP